MPFATALREVGISIDFIVGGVGGTGCKVHLLQWLAW